MFAASSVNDGRTAFAPVRRFETDRQSEDKVFGRLDRQRYVRLLSIAGRDVLSKVTIQNFRKFANFTVHLRDANILVGPNNAGKSSILDGFRLLAACLRFARITSPQLKSVPGFGVVASLNVPEGRLPFDSRNISRDYNKDPAIFEFSHKNGNKLRIELRDEGAASVSLVGPLRAPKTTGAFRKEFPIEVIVVPTLAPLEPEEQHVTDQTVARNLGTKLLSRTFRNTWLRESDERFAAFASMVEGDWNKIKLHKPTMERGTPARVTMYFEENRITREVQWGGFGFQVWLQINTHLLKSSDSSILIIDEPDVYLHPELQRKLFHRIKRNFPQFAMATHSTEIINEADPSDIVVIDATKQNSRRISSDEQIVAVRRYLGSSENADFARIAKARKIIFVEGQDRKILTRFARRLGYEKFEHALNVPIVTLGGFAEWRKASATRWALKEILGIDAEFYCLFDRDFRTQTQVDQFLLENDEQGSRVHILKRKEIENYLLIPRAISAAVTRKANERFGSSHNIVQEDVENALRAAANELKPYVQSRYCDSEIACHESRGAKLSRASVIEMANAKVDASYKNLEDALAISPGKKVLAKLNETLQAKYQLSLTEAAIIECVAKQDNLDDLHEVLKRFDIFCSES